MKKIEFKEELPPIKIIVDNKRLSLNNLNFHEIKNRRASQNARPIRILITFGRLRILTIRGLLMAYVNII